MKPPPPPSPAAVRVDLHRFVDEYHWTWAMARNLINRTHTAEYTIKALHKMHGEK